jgi:UDP-N-acetylmuramoyl-L-alanyl-D-glutamate--2,6-diaminopimelate ligase
VAPTRPSRPPRTPLTRVVGLLTDAHVPLAVEDRADLLDAVAVTGVTLDSRSVQPGDLWVAAPGAATHGARFAATAVERGAVAVVTDADGLARCRAVLGDPLPVPVLVVAGPRSVLGRLAAEVYGDPTAGLRLLGVTGTQGKTTTTRLAEGALQAAGVRAGVIGTVGTRVAGDDVASALTTPEAPELHALFAVMRERQVEACAMEVSSHALVMGRVDGVRFDVAAFTNLGRDHLDFHADVEDYFAAKASLFTAERAGLALVNHDDPWGRRLADALRTRGDVPVRTYAVADDAGTRDRADWQASEVVATASGSAFLVETPDGRRVAAEVRLPGRFNVSNALCALAGLAELGYPVEEVARGLRAVKGVPGRLEVVDAGQGFLAVVDYAHKPDAVEAVLRDLRARTSGRLVVVLGAGGDRDRGKRPLMGEVAARWADVLVVTDDNPRSEDPATIRREVLTGAERADAGSDRRARLHDVGDRRTALHLAVEQAGSAGDTVAVLGKGHETGQEVAGVTHPFDDRVELRAALEAGRTSEVAPWSR